ncbi:MAG: hypothetical protein WAN11_05975 [Syntrophobacteraceae bacterium]
MADIGRLEIRNAAAKLIEFTIDELAEELHISSHKALHAVWAAMRAFRISGLVEKTAPGTFRYKGHMLGSLKMKMWRAMLVKGRFSQSDIVTLSGATRIYVRRFLLLLRSKQVVMHVSGRGYSGAIYGLVDPDSAPLEPPVERRQSKCKREGVN